LIIPHPFGFASHTKYRQEPIWYGTGRAGFDAQSIVSILDSCSFDPFDFAQGRLCSRQVPQE